MVLYYMYHSRIHRESSMNCNSKMEISPKETEYKHQEKNYGEYLSPIATDVNLLMYLWFTNSYFPDILHCFITIDVWMKFID